jgi:hypothetical protein
MKIIVLNANNTPINLTSFKKGFKLIYKGKAEVVISQDGGKSLIGGRYARPKVIRLLRYVYLPYRTIGLSKAGIFKRDGNRCVYCNSNKDLTLDHVLPRSRGGENSWGNLVTCCSKCNGKKDDMTPKEAGMTLLRKPYIPTLADLLDIDVKEINRISFEQAGATYFE